MLDDGRRLFLANKTLLGGKGGKEDFLYKNFD